MKIGYVGNYNAPHTTENHLAATLEKLGHEVIRLQENEIRPDVLTMMIGACDWDLFLFTRTWDDLVTLEHLALLRGRKIPSASYHLDLYVGLKREDGLDNDPFWRTDYVFTPDGAPATQAVMEAKGINHIYMKPGVFEPECYLAEKNPDHALDVAFVGGGSPTGEGPQYGHDEWPYRGELLKWLQDTYGDRYCKFGWPQQTVRNEALNEVYANTKVIVGDSLCLNFDHPYYWSDRVYETIGRGGFIIHPFIKGMDEEFTDGQNIAFYEYGNFDQLKSTIDYYLEHDEERERIRQAGHEFVKNNATYTQRLQRMLDIIFGDTATSHIVYDEASEISDKDMETVMKLTSSEAPADAVPTPSSEGTSALKISLGAGTEPEDGYVNVDIVPLKGIDVLHNLMQYPWPFEDSTAEHIKAKDVIEHMATHLPDGRNSVIAFIEECHRILKPGGKLWIQTPSWDADFLWIDPTHVRGFDIRSFDFFDDTTDFGRGTGFYSPAKFKVAAERTENGNLQFSMIKNKESNDE
jgi:SAM-dependent methyltransferase